MKFLREKDLWTAGGVSETMTAEANSTDAAIKMAAGEFHFKGGKSWDGKCLYVTVICRRNASKSQCQLRKIQQSLSWSQDSGIGCN